MQDSSRCWGARELAVRGGGGRRRGACRRGGGGRRRRRRRGGLGRAIEDGARRRGGPGRATTGEDGPTMRGEGRRHDDAAGR